MKEWRRKRRKLSRMETRRSGLSSSRDGHDEHLARVSAIVTVGVRDDGLGRQVAEDGPNRRAEATGRAADLNAATEEHALDGAAVTTSARVAGAGRLHGSVPDLSARASVEGVPDGDRRAVVRRRAAETAAVDAGVDIAGVSATLDLEARLPHCPAARLDEHVRTIARRTRNRQQRMRWPDSCPRWARGRHRHYEGQARALS